MKICFIGMNTEAFYLEVEPSDIIFHLIELIEKKIDDGYICIKDEKTSLLLYKGKYLELKRTLSSYGIQNLDLIFCKFIDTAEYCNCMLLENLIKYEKDLDIGFNPDLLQRNELNVNLIYFDKNLTDIENYDYYNNFKVDVVGGFYAMDDLEIFDNYLLKIYINDFIPFLVITTCSDVEQVIPICKKFDFIKEVIIFCRCRNYCSHEHYIKDYPGYVKEVLSNIESVYSYLKRPTKDERDKTISYLFYRRYYFTLEDIKMDKQYLQCPVISAIEYDKCYFLIHRAYSHFFGKIKDINEKPVFQVENYIKMLDELKKNNKFELYESFQKLCEINDNNSFVEKSIREYTTEGDFCYILNRMMRHFESGLIALSYFIGPFIYGLNKYILENPSFAMSKDMKLYRYLTISKLDFYLYKINIGHIICFPAFTSTASIDKGFHPTSKALKVNSINNKETMVVKLIFIYKHEKENISPGIIIEDKKDSKGCYLSKYHNEHEVLLFPFTFVRINNIFSEKGYQTVLLEIINKDFYLEYLLKNNVDNRILFTDLDYNKNLKKITIPNKAINTNEVHESKKEVQATSIKEKKNSNNFQVNYELDESDKEKYNCECIIV